MPTGRRLGQAIVQTTLLLAMVISTGRFAFCQPQSSASTESGFTKETISVGDESAVDKAAPDFTLPDSYGKAHKLSDFKGKIVVLEWINFSCPFVGKHYQSGNMQKLQKNYKDKGVVWLSICSSAKGRPGYLEPAEINKAIKDQWAAPAYYLIDEDGTVGKRYGAKATPTMCIIDKQGILLYKGAIDDKPTTDPEDIPIAKNYVRMALDEVLAGKPVTNKGSKPYGCSIKYQN